MSRPGGKYQLQTKRTQLAKNKTLKISLILSEFMEFMLKWNCYENKKKQNEERKNRIYYLRSQLKSFVRFLYDFEVLDVNKEEKAIY